MLNLTQTTHNNQRESMIFSLQVNNMGLQRTHTHQRVNIVYPVQKSDKVAEEIKTAKDKIYNLVGEIKGEI